MMTVMMEGGIVPLRLSLHLSSHLRFAWLPGIHTIKHHDTGIDAFFFRAYYLLVLLSCELGRRFPSYFLILSCPASYILSVSL